MGNTLVKDRFGIHCIALHHKERPSYEFLITLILLQNNHVNFSNVIN